jgi:hypothetical protein
MHRRLDTSFRVGGRENTFAHNRRPMREPGEDHEPTKATPHSSSRRSADRPMLPRTSCPAAWTRRIGASWMGCSPSPSATTKLERNGSVSTFRGDSS